ncbi:MAG: DNA mismatch repair endonuclease MutL [Tenericutes bacterium]|nr:DNA mismatch repair endonuclease MutL [Mycoplasmatota bacterium]
MSVIKIMDEILSNKIAAGEVVERCVSVVKELVENSIDASSKKIKIELKESGIKEIKVTDDGTGMDREDAINAFGRHATSKLLNEDDLFRIDTLGFRGEALPSIASVSEVILKTSTGDIGTEVTIKGGKLINESKTDSRKGTIITVKNIFYNTPARLKHLKSIYAELAVITDYVDKMALANPSISFSLYNDSKLLFNTDGSNDLLKVINEVYGLNVSKKMIKIEASDDEYDIEGYISYPEVTKSNRNHITTFVNGRLVKNYELIKAINDSYHTYKPEDKYPIVVLNIKVDFSLVDVNIHPTKQDIKFGKIEELKSLLSISIKKALNKTLLIPEVNTKVEDKTIEYEDIKLSLEDISVNETHNEESKEVLITNNKMDIPMIYPIGLAKGTYIIAQNELGIYLIDQHAANERINYEYYLKKVPSNKDVQNMIIPITIELTKKEYIIVKENINILEDLGFEVEEFGENSLIFRSHPVWLKQDYEEESIKRLLDLIVLIEKDFNKEKFMENIAITMSCKLSIKANENISLDEMELLIKKLRACDNPYTCPHGRPTIISFTNYELEKLFKRVM